MNLNQIWTVKYGPRSIDDLIVDDDIRLIVKGFGKAEQIPNLLFTGPPGVGKCLDGDEELLLYVDDYEYEKIMTYLRTPVAPEIK